jgi:hypothetical protein
LLYGPERHEPLAGDAWSEDAAGCGLDDPRAARQVHRLQIEAARHPRRTTRVPALPSADGEQL